jgi:hypothetical protein
MVQILKIDGTRTGWAVIPIDYAARDLVASSKAAETIYNALRAIHVHILQKQDNCTVQSIPFHIYF